MKYHLHPTGKSSSDTLFPPLFPTPTIGEGSRIPLGDSTCVLTVLFIAVVCTVILPITAPGQANATA
jgi:hypothetical protein